MSIWWLRRRPIGRLYILRVLRRSGISPSDLLSVYYSLGRSILEYACSVWHTSLPNYLCNRIEQVQKRALRIIYPGLHYVDVLEIAHCPRLDVRRQEICLQTFKKICDPGCRLHHLIPPIRSNAHGRTLRNNNCVSLPNCRTDRLKQSFVPTML